MSFLLRLLRHILMEACQLRRRLWHMILTSFGMRKYTVRFVTADTFSRLSCIVISLPMTVTVTVLVYALDTWTHDVNLCVGLLSLTHSLFLFLPHLYMMWRC